MLKSTDDRQKRNKHHHQTYPSFFGPGNAFSAALSLKLERDLDCAALTELEDLSHLPLSTVGEILGLRHYHVDLELQHEVLEGFKY